MRKDTIRMVVLVLLVGLFAQQSFAQREVPVLSMQNGGVLDGLAQAILADSAARAAALPQTTTYVLENGGTYPIIETIVADGFFLHIKTADPAGARAALVPSPREDQGYNRIFEIRHDTKIEGLIVESLRSYIDGAADISRYNIRQYNGANLTAINCEVAHGRKDGAFSAWEDGSSIFLEDCVVHSCGYFRDIGPSGRGIDGRAVMDTISVVNCTFFNLTANIYMNIFHNDISVFIFDHNTCYNTGQNLRIARSHETTITNNIFFNTVLYGTHFPENLASDIEYEAMFVLSMDDTVANTDWVVNIANNNIAWEQQYIDLWAAQDTTEAPGIITPTLLAANSAPGEVSFEEVLTLVAPGSSMYEYIAACFADPHTDDYPPAFYFGLVTDLDFSYGTSAVSYTAAAGDFPLGDLNWYPDKKAEWEDWVATGVENEPSGPTNFSLAQNYPNPFNPATTIRFTLKKSDMTTVTVYNILGHEIQTLVSKKLSAGSHSYQFNAADLPSGTYFYRVKSGSQVALRKMLLMK